MAKNADNTDNGPRLVNVLPMNDPRAQQQLLSGFYGVESGAWRWTSGKFSVVLRTPPNAETRGAALKFQFALPDSLIKQLDNLTLMAKTGDTSLPPATYNTSGSKIYTADIPSSALQGTSARIDFWLNKSIPPGPVERRELGVVATEVALLAK